MIDVMTLAPSLDEQSKIIAINQKEVLTIYNWFKNNTSISYEKFCRYFDSFKFKIVQRYYSKYIVILGLYEGEFVLRAILLLLGINYESLISYDDFILILTEISDDFVISSKYLKTNLNFPIEFNTLLNFLDENPKAYEKFQSLQKSVGHCLFPKRHQYQEILQRKINMLYADEYMRENGGVKPKASCMYMIKNILFGDPYPYRFDYQILPSESDDSILELLNYFKVEFVERFDNKLLVKPLPSYQNPNISSLKNEGEILTFRSKSIDRKIHDQVANKRCSSRSMYEIRSDYLEELNNNSCSPSKALVKKSALSIDNNAVNEEEKIKIIFVDEIECKVEEDTNLS